MRARVSPSVIRGRIKAPQSKSLAIRLLFSGLLGVVKLEGLQESNDVVAARNAIDSLKNNRLGLRMLNLGGSGTTLRMLLPVLAFKGIECEIHGDETLERRPLAAVKTWLESNGVSMSSDRLPLRISGKIDTDTVEISGSESSQYISGIIYGMLLSGGGRIRIIPPARSASYIEMTCSVLNSLGCRIKNRGLEIEVEPLDTEIRYQGGVPGDFLLSSFYAIAALLTEGEVSITNLFNPEWSRGDSRIVDLLGSAGADSQLKESTWRVSGRGNLTPLESDVDDSPDMAVSLAALAAAARGMSVIGGTDLLATKESNRIDSISMTLESFGLEVTSTNGLRIINKGEIHPGKVGDWKDHRIAMLGTVIALKNGGTINGAESVAKSNPRFYDDLTMLGGRISLES